MSCTLGLAWRPARLDMSQPLALPLSLMHPARRRVMGSLNQAAGHGQAVSRQLARTRAERQQGRQALAAPVREPSAALRSHARCVTGTVKAPELDHQAAPPPPPRTLPPPPLSAAPVGLRTHARCVTGTIKAPELGHQAILPYPPPSPLFLPPL